MQLPQYADYYFDKNCDVNRLLPLVLLCAPPPPTPLLYARLTKGILWHAGIISRVPCEMRRPWSRCGWGGAGASCAPPGVPAAPWSRTTAPRHRSLLLRPRCYLNIHNKIFMMQPHVYRRFITSVWTVLCGAATITVNRTIWNNFMS